MMWAFAIKSKLTAALLLGGVLAVVILTNFSERSNNKRINTAVASIYEDRLVVEGYIFEYAQALRQIEEIAENNTYSPTEKRVLILQNLSGLEKLHRLYANTRLTTSEKTNFNNFKTLCGTIKTEALANNYNNVETITKHAGSILTTLSSIQMSEAKLQMDSVLKISSLSGIISQLELVTLIVIAVLVQILIFSSRTIVKARVPGNVHLN